MIKQLIFQYQKTLRMVGDIVYSLQYHIVWVTKYRKPIFTGSIEADVRQYLLETMQSLEMRPLAMEVMPDHIHLLVDCKPQLRLSDAVKNTERQYRQVALFKAFRSLKNNSGVGICGTHLTLLLP